MVARRRVRNVSRATRRTGSLMWVTTLVNINVEDTDVSFAALVERGDWIPGGGGALISGCTLMGIRGYISCIADGTGPVGVGGVRSYIALFDNESNVAQASADPTLAEVYNNEQVLFSQGEQNLNAFPSEGSNVLWQSPGIPLNVKAKRKLTSDQTIFWVAKCPNSGDSYQILGLFRALLKIY